MMKHLFNFISLGFIAFVLALSCAKETDTPSNPSDSEGNLITITVGAPQDLQTRVTYSTDPADEDKLRVRWHSDDKIVINGNVFTISSLIDDGAQAEFTGTAPGAGPYTIFYAGNEAEAKTLAQIQGMDYSVQTQPSNGATTHLWFAAKLTGVDSYDNIHFSSDWASDHNGSYQQSGALRIRIQKPEGVTSVRSVTLTAPSEIFYKDNNLNAKVSSITVNLDGAADISSDTHIIAYAMLPWSEVALPAGSYQFSFLTGDYNLYLKTKDLTAASLASTSVNVFKINKTDFALQRYAGGTGVENDPWLIGNASHMLHMSADGADDVVKYFKMIADVDMTSVAAADWTPYNIGDGFKKGVVFDGDSHTISNFNMQGRSGVNYMSVFGILNGTVKNVTFDNCSITSNQASPLGLVAAWAGTSGGSVQSTWMEVHATSCAVTSNYKTNNVGGLAGSADGSTFTNCSYDGTVERGSTYTDTGYRYLGGLVGGVPAGTLGAIRVTFSGCTTSGSVTDPNPSIGGILGGMHSNATVTMDDCHSTMDITAGGKVAGGLIGYTGGAKVENSSYDGTITSTVTGDCYAGGIVAYTAHYVQISNCTASGTIACDDAGSIIGGITGGLNPQNGDTNDITFTDCTCTMDITGGMKIGGILGITSSNDYGANRIISGCSYSGTLTAKKYDSTSTNDNKNTTYVGGIVGYSRKLSIEKCAVTGEVKTTVNGNRVGGIAGYAYSVTLEKCLVKGKVTTAGGEQKGGLVGYMLGTTPSIKKSAFIGDFSSTGGAHGGGIAGRADGATIEDCYASLTSYTVNGQRQGGIVGNGAAGNLTIRRCFVNAESLSDNNFHIGGIIGNATGGNNEANFAKQINVTAEKCIAWINAITATGGTVTQWGSGAIIGASAKFNTLTDNYRKPGMTVSYNQAWSGDGWPLVYDQDNTSSSVPLIFYDGTSDASASGWAQTHYHGKSAERAWTDAGDAAPATITISALAQKIGWPSATWDFSGSVPKLLGLPEGQ